MDKRNSRRLIAGIVALVLGLFAVTLYASRGRRVAIDELPFRWLGVVSVQFEDDASPQGGNGWKFNAVTQAPTPVELPVGMVLQVGEQEFNRVWINSNGFVSLTLDKNGTLTGAPWKFEAPGAASFDGVPDDVNVIAPFYADTVTRRPADNCPDGSQFDQSEQFLERECDVTYALLDGDADGDNPDDPEDDPPFWKGMRVTWGYGGQEDNGQPDRGLPQQGGDSDVKNRFQLKLIDRSGATGNGDFDIEFNYDDLAWQSANTLVGFKVAGVTMDFSRLLAKPFQTDLDDCPDPPTPFPDPFFDRNTPLACNSITIEVRDGKPKLATYTADVSVQLLAGGVGSIHTTDTFQLDVQLTNGNDNEATNVEVTLQLPSETTIVSASQGVTCTPGTGSAVCNFGSIDPNGLKASVLDLRSMHDGQRKYSAQVAADQYDSNTTNDLSEVTLNLAASADVAITGCAPSGAVTQGNSVTLQCNARNNGPQDATGIAVTADLPAFLTLVPGSGCTASGARVTCTAPTLANTATTTFTMTLNGASAGSANVSATIDADQNDPVTTNNTQSAPVTVSERPRPSGGGSLSIWLLLSLALLTMRQRSWAISR